MVESVRVWAVNLASEDRGGIECRMSLEGGHLVLASDGETEAARIALADVAKVRRLRGTPVLVLEHVHVTGQQRLAIFFVKPPPMPGKSSRRRTRRNSITYLSTLNRGMVDLLKAWEREIRSVRAAGQRDSTDAKRRPREE